MHSPFSHTSGISLHSSMSNRNRESDEVKANINPWGGKPYQSPAVWWCQCNILVSCCRTTQQTHLGRQRKGVNIFWCLWHRLKWVCTKLYRCWAQDTVHRVYSRHGQCCRSSSTSFWSCWRSALHHTSCCQNKSSCSSSSSSCLPGKERGCPTQTWHSRMDKAAAVRLTHAVVSAVDLHVIHRADAGVVPDGVVAGSWATDAGPIALVDICKQMGTHRSRLFVSNVCASHNSTSVCSSFLDHRPCWWSYFEYLF